MPRKRGNFSGSFNRAGYSYRHLERAERLAHAKAQSASWWLDGSTFYDKLHDTEAERMARTASPVYVKALNE